MATYTGSGGRSPTYPRHRGGSVSGNKFVFCTDSDLGSPDADVQALNIVSVIKSSQITVDEKFFGMHVSQPSSYGIADSDIIFKTVRSHDMANGASRWKFIETADNVWDFSNMDLWVNAHYAAGRDIIFTLFGTPTFHSARATEQGAYGPANLGIQAEPGDMAKWDRFCTKMIERYAGKIKYWEIWNEPNIGNVGTYTGAVGADTAVGLDGTTTNFFFSGLWTKLAEMTRRASVAIKAVDPTAKILSPCVQGWASSGTDKSGAYFTGMMEASDGAGGKLKDHIDVVAIHLYTPNSVAGLVTMIDRAIAVKNTASLSALELWDTESGPLGPTAMQIPDSSMNRYLTRHLITLAGKGIKRHCLYQLDGGSGLSASIYNRPSCYAHWNNLRTLLMSGNITKASALVDGRVAYYTTAGGSTPIIV